MLRQNRRFLSEQKTARPLIYRYKSTFVPDKSSLARQRHFWWEGASAPLGPLASYAYGYTETKRTVLIDIYNNSKHILKISPVREWRSTPTYCQLQTHVKQKLRHSKTRPR